MAQSRINWKRGDYISLGRAVSDFNKKINELQKEENKLYLPEIIDYKEAKENITTRSELKRVINSLRRFGREGAEELYITEAGENITVWERKELGIQSRIAQNRLQAELKKLNEPLEGGISRIQMGSIRAREIESQLKNLKQIESKKGYEFIMLRERIKNMGRSDYQMRKAITYRKNFMNELKNLAINSPEFKTVFDYFNKIKNPIEFFNTTQKSTALQDFFEWYQQPESYASFATREDLAEYILKEYQ